MRTTLNLLTALATVLAIAAEARAQGNFAPARPLVHPQVVRPAIAPVADVHRLTRKPGAPSVAATGSDDEDRTDATAGSEAGNSANRQRLPESVMDSRRPPALHGPAVMARRAVPQAPVPPARPAVADGSPQPEPPTIEAGAARHGPQAGPPVSVPGERRIPDHLRLGFVETDLAAMRDLRDWLAGREAVDRGALGGGTGDGNDLSNWRDRFGHDRQASERSSGGIIARVTGGAFDSRDVREAAAGHDGEEGFRPPRRDSPRLGRPGRAGHGLRGRGPVSQDGPSSDGGGSQETRASCGRNCVKWRVVSDDGSTTTGVLRWFPASSNTSDDGDLSNGIEGEGVMFTKTERRYPNGSRKRGETWAAFDSERRRTEISDSQTSEGHEDEDGVIHLPIVLIEGGTDQPTDPMYGSGGEPLLFECFDPVFPCFRPGVDSEDTVSQPGRGAEEELRPATPSVGERLRAVTQPVPGHAGGGSSAGGGGQHRVPCIRAKCNEPRPG